MDNGVYADLLDSLSPLTKSGIDPDEALLDRKGTMDKLLGTNAAPQSWLDKAQASDSPAPIMGRVQAPPQGGAVPGGVTPSGNASSLATQNAGTIGQMQSDYTKASQDVQREADQPDISTITAPLQAQRTKDATPVNAYDPQTGKVLDQYKPTFAQRLMRGVGGFARGGVFGTVDPTIGGGQAYGAPNAQYGRDVQQQQGRVASDDQQMKAAADNWKAQNDRLKAVAADRGKLATMGKDVTGASVEQQAVPIKQQEADTGTENAKTSAVEAYNKSPDAKAATTAAEFTAAQKQADQMGLKGQQRTLFLANGKIPDPRQATAEEVAAAQATKVFTQQYGHPPQTLEDFTKVRQAAGGKTGGTQMMVPDGKGGMTLTNVQPGDVVPQGATTLKGMEANSKNADKEAKSAQAIVDEADLAHQAAAEADKGNAEGDVDLALSFFKTIKGSNGSGIRFTQQEANLIKGARDTAGDIQSVAQKVVGGGQMFTPEQRKNVLKIIDIHAGAAKKHVGSGSSPVENGAPPNGAKVRDYTSLGNK